MRRKQAINAREEGGGRERWLRSSERKLTSDSQARLNALRTREPHHDRVFESVHNGGPTAFQVVVKIPNGEHRCGGWTSNRAQHPSLRLSKAGCSIILESSQLESVNLHGRLDESENMAQLHEPTNRLTTTKFTTRKSKNRRDGIYNTNRHRKLRLGWKMEGGGE